MAAISVLVVDDSVVIRRLISNALDADPDIAVVGTAANGRIALTKLAQLNPDCLTLDIEMPELDGLGTLREVRRTHPRLPVIMFSTLTERGARSTLDALALGASDYVTKPANVGSVPQAIASVQSQLIPKIKALCGSRMARSLFSTPAAAPPGAPRVATTGTPPLRPFGSATPPVTVPAAGSVSLSPGGSGPAPQGRLELLAIGSSTGGPDALTEILPALPASFPVPIVITQHMPPVFTRLFAQRLDTKSALSVKEAEDGDVLRPGLVLLAPGDRHLVLERIGDSVRARLSTAPPENFCRPAVDVMFRSAATVFGGGVLAVVLTGMGSDGGRGADVLRRAGAEVVVQDEPTSIVWGMPGTVASAGLAHRILPLGAIAADITSTIGRRRGVPALSERSPA